MACHGDLRCTGCRVRGARASPTIAYYAGANPQALWQAGGATALFIAGCGAAGYATRRDLSAIARASFWGLVALILFGVVMIFVNIPGGSLALRAAGQAPGATAFTPR